MKDSMKMIIAVLVTAVVCIAGTYVIASNGNSNEGETITIKGSTTIQPLMDKYQEEFEKYSNITLEISGGGSGEGTKAAINGTANIGMASRALKDSELSQGLVATKIGKDAVAVIVNADVTGVTSLTQAQLTGIYNGTITNWNQVGGPDKTIAPIIREAGSGTRECFETKTGEMPAQNSYAVQASTGGMITQVNQTPGAIGYVSLGSLNSSCHPVGYEGVTASVDNVNNGSYGIVRDLVLATKGSPTGATAFFINWILSEQGQKILENAGFIKL